MSMMQEWESLLETAGNIKNDSDAKTFFRKVVRLSKKLFVSSVEAKSDKPFTAEDAFNAWYDVKQNLIKLGKPMGWDIRWTIGGDWCHVSCGYYRQEPYSSWGVEGLERMTAWIFQCPKEKHIPKGNDITRIDGKLFHETRRSRQENNTCQRKDQISVKNEHKAWFPEWVYRWYLDEDRKSFEPGGILHGRSVYECNFAILRAIELYCDVDLGKGSDDTFIRSATECLYDALSQEDRKKYEATLKFN